MKIALLGALDTPINKNALGGTEIWTYAFAEGLKKRGHSVTLFANSESQFSGELVKVVKQDELHENTEEKALSVQKVYLFSVYAMAQAIKQQGRFDLIQVSSTNFQNFLPLSILAKCPVFATIHSSDLSFEDASTIFGYFPEVNYIFISNNFASRWPKPRNHKIIYNGIDFSSFTFGPKASDYYFWMGRIHRSKGVEDAVKFSQLSGKKVVIAGPVRDQEYFNKVVKPYLGKNLEFVGSLNHREKVKYYKNAKAFLMPIKWDEPFGLVALESMACGTPVLAYKRGALPEIISDGVNGFLAEADDVKTLVKLSANISSLDRKLIRKSVEKKFSLERLLDDYLNYYESILEKT